MFGVGVTMHVCDRRVCSFTVEVMYVSDRRLCSGWRLQCMCVTEGYVRGGSYSVCVRQWRKFTPCT
jgi:hypothetical protein